jgi:hypothetical protein
MGHHSVTVIIVSHTTSRVAVRLTGDGMGPGQPDSKAGRCVGTGWRVRWECGGRRGGVKTLSPLLWILSLLGGTFQGQWVYQTARQAGTLGRDGMCVGCRGRRRGDGGGVQVTLFLLGGTLQGRWVNQTARQAGTIGRDGMCVGCRGRRRGDGRRGVQVTLFLLGGTLQGRWVNQTARQAGTEGTAE